MLRDYGSASRQDEGRGVLKGSCGGVSASDPPDFLDLLAAQLLGQIVVLKSDGVGVGDHALDLVQRGMLLDDNIRSVGELGHPQ